MKRVKRYTLDVTEKQLEELILCVNIAIDRGLGYGMATHREEALLEANRKRLGDKLERIRTEVKS